MVRVAWVVKLFLVVLSIPWYTIDLDLVKTRFSTSLVLVTSGLVLFCSCFNLETNTVLEILEMIQIQLLCTIYLKNTWSKWSLE